MFHAVHETTHNVLGAGIALKGSLVLIMHVLIMSYQIESNV